MSDGVRAMWMRGGTSKGGYFLEGELPEDPAERDAFLLRIMGSPDPRQIDGLGGAASLASKVAVVSPGKDPGIDVEYLFLQVFLDRPVVSAAQTCGNILAGVGPFALERGLVAARPGETEVVIRNTNTGQIVRAAVPTPGGRVRYEGGTAIDGVPGTAAPIPLLFRGMAGSKCGALLPSGNLSDRVEGVECTLIDNGMPAVLIRASDLGIAGDEPPEALEGNAELKALVEKIRLAAGPRMALGDVGAQPVPKMCLLSAPCDGGALMTRCFIPHVCHRTIGVLCAVSVATGWLLEAPAAVDAAPVPEGREAAAVIEHPSGSLTVVLRRDAEGNVFEAGSVRTARKLFDGVVFA